MIKFTFHGGMMMEIVLDDGYKILLDPYIRENPQCVAEVSDFYDADLILITHAASDHFGDASELMECSHAKVICGREGFFKIKKECPNVQDDRYIPTIYGDARTIHGVTIRTLPAWHGSGIMIDGIRHNYPPFGFVLQMAPRVTYYHPGDTAIFSDLKLIRDLYKPNVMVVGISNVTPAAPKEMTARDAATVVGWITPDVAIPCHYYPGDPSLEEFMNNVQVLAPYTEIKPSIGKSFTFEPCRVIDC